MTEFSEEEISRAIGILRTNGMKLEQVGIGYIIASDSDSKFRINIFNRIMAIKTICLV